MLIYCGNLKYEGQDPNSESKRDGDRFFSLIAELLLDQKSRNQNYDADLTVCSRNDAKTYSTRAPQGASPVYLTTTGHIYNSAGMCKHANVILDCYCILLKIHILKA